MELNTRKCLRRRRISNNEFVAPDEKEEKKK